MNKLKIIFFGLFVASLAPVVILVGSKFIKTGSFDFEMMLALVLLFYPFSAFATFTLGAAAFALLSKVNLIRWWSSVLSGFLIGASMALILRLPALAPSTETLNLGVIGSISALIFWVILRMGQRFDRS